MKRINWSKALVVILCAAFLLSATFLAVHLEHSCCHDECMVCPVLARCLELLNLGALVCVLSGVCPRLMTASSLSAQRRTSGPPQTPVHQKIKLLC